MLGCAWLAFTTTIATDLSLFIPKTDPTARLLTELQAGPAARLILVGLEGGSEQSRAATSQRLAEHLQEKNLFVRVANGAQSLADDTQQLLFAYRYLLSPAVTPQRFTSTALRHALQQRLQALTSPLSTFEKRLLPTDPSGELLTLLQTWQGSNRQPEQRHGVWFSPQGKWALLLVETRAGGFDPEAQQTALTIIQNAFSTVQKDPEMTLLLSGPGVFAALSSATIRFEAQSLSIAASLAVVMILFITFRSPRLVLLGALPLASAIVVATATVYVLFGGIYGITLAFGITLLGVAIDYPIHFFSHLHRQETVQHTLQNIWPTLRLSVVTTALGFSAMLGKDFVGLSQLGIFAIAGLLTAAACTRWLLPTLLPPVWNAHPIPSASPWMKPLLDPSRSLAVGVIGTGLAILLALVIIAPPVWEDDLAALSPIPEHAIALDRELRTALGAPEPGHMIVVTAGDVETVLQLSETATQQLRELIKKDLLRGFDGATRYLPSQRTQRVRQTALPTQEQLQKNLREASADLPFKPGLFKPFLEAIENARTQPFLRPQDLAGTALGARINSLLFENDGHWTALLPLVGVQDSSQLKDIFPELASQDGLFYLNLKTTTERLVADFRNAALVRLGWGAVLIAGVLWFGLGSLRRMLAVLLPVLLAVVLDIAVLLGLGERLNLFHLVSLLLVVGIGIDYSLFFSRADVDFAMRQRTLRAVLLCSSSTLAVFGMLAMSKLPVLAAIGQTASIGVVASLLMALVLARQLARQGENVPQPK
jgi:predicted exporter